MRNDDFKRRLQALQSLIRKELARTDLKALVYGAIADMDIQALVHEELVSMGLHEQFKFNMSSSFTGPVQQPRVLH